MNGTVKDFGGCQVHHVGSYCVRISTLLRTLSRQEVGCLDDLFVFNFALTNERIVQRA